MAVTPVFVSAYLRSGRRAQRRIGLAALAGAALVLVATAGLVFAGLQSERQLRDAANEVRDGLEALRANEPERAVALLVAANEDFEAAEQALGTWGRPARVVPVLGHQARAAAVVAGEGAQLSAAAADATVQADIDDLEFDDGVLDLELVAGFEQPLEQAYEALAGASEAVAEARTMWLVDPLSSAIARFGDEVDQALPDAELAIQGVRLAPALFGGEGERHYFIAFTQPAEARGLGGFIGNYGELTAIDGDLELTRSGRIRRAHRRPGGRPADPQRARGLPDPLRPVAAGAVPPGPHLQPRRALGRPGHGGALPPGRAARRWTGRSSWTRWRWRRSWSSPGRSRWRAGPSPSRRRTRRTS